jgi:hypothetical protein
MAVRPYRPPPLGILNENGVTYFDPMLAAGATVEVAIIAKNTVRYRTDPGQGNLAQVDSQGLLTGASAPVSKIPLSLPPPRPVEAPTVALPVASSALKVVLLENSDFRDLEVQQMKTQDIGDGASLLSFAGDGSATVAASNRPAFLVLAGTEGEANTQIELARLQVSKGLRQVVYSAAGKRSASSVPVAVTKVSPTVLRVTVGQGLPPGEYALLPAGLNRAFLFSVKN